MLPRPLIIALALLPAGLAPPRIALAQVSVDPHALDQLGGTAATPAPEASTHETRPPVRHPPLRHPVHPVEPHETSEAHPAHPPAGKVPVKVAKPPSLPAAPPAVAVIPPPSEQPPAHPSAPPPLPTVSASAPGEASKIDGGLRITFGPADSDLNPATESALRVMADAARSDPNTAFNVTAFAPGKPEDPSTPRRLSLSRALAARSVLINDGIPSTRIYVRVMGVNGSPGGAGDGQGCAPPDRVDVTVARIGGANSVIAHPAPPPPAKPPAPKT